MGGTVTYLAEVEAAVPVVLSPWGGAVDDDPLRARWARPGGPAGDLSWADDQLSLAGRPRHAPAQQVRTWNLSSIWRLPTAHGDAWLKAVPPFFAHEGRLISAIDGPTVPPLIAYDGQGRVLLDHVDGEDRYGATGPDLLAMVDTLVDIQQAWIDRTDDLHELGLPDWRCRPFLAAAADCIERAGGALTLEDHRRLDALVASGERRFADLGSCGVPDTLVHGDFHSGNVRMAPGGQPVLLDWGDAGIGNPLFDMTAFTDRILDGDRPKARQQFAQRWLAVAPGSDPGRAAALIAPLGALRQAIVYRMFLDGIERSERRFHEADVPLWLHRAAEIAGEAATPTQ